MFQELKTSTHKCDSSYSGLVTGTLPIKETQALLLAAVSESVN